MFFIVKVTPGRERAAAEVIMYKALAENFEIFSVVVPEDLKGFIYTEAKTAYQIDLVSQDIKDVRGRLQGIVKDEEISKYFVEKPTIEEFSVGDIVEVKTGVFKRMKARVVDVDRAKNEVTIELQESGSIFPITLSMDLVRLVEKGRKQV
ncbi:MAG: transcription elongation factor Spt5 [Thermoproteota archaeon]|nr:transcription elongation factor Spt5 [Candidatus Brockarchaeota archaeon]MBO3801506.1 transcription elongation factor Spt5 [Candidatus Brockarchaeota archaeon]